MSNFSKFPRETSVNLKKTEASNIAISNIIADVKNEK
jgi:hypothetical protein